MSKFLTTLLAAVFAAVTVTTVAFAQEKTAPKKANPVTAACKGKKAGDEVTVDGKKVKCPAPKKAAKKSEPTKEMKKGEGTKAESMK